jgi:hypothetical protein
MNSLEAALATYSLLRNAEVTDRLGLDPAGASRLGLALVGGVRRCRMTRLLCLRGRTGPASPRPLRRRLTVTLTPLAETGDALEVAILIDRSGSMDAPAGGRRSHVSKHKAAMVALNAVAGSLRPGDAIELWQFDTELHHVGSVRSEGGGGSASALQKRFRALVGRLDDPRGGTEIGEALAGVLARSPARDVLVVTDGQSHALDIQALASAGRRVSVLLVGEGSLEANVGHLAALTGGEIFTAMRSDMRGVLAAALG